jgi:hypothetical protein
MPNEGERAMKLDICGGETIGDSGDVQRLVAEHETGVKECSTCQGTGAGDTECNYCRACMGFGVLFGKAS